MRQHQTADAVDQVIDLAHPHQFAFLLHQVQLRLDLWVSGLRYLSRDPLEQSAPMVDPSHQGDCLNGAATMPIATVGFTGRQERHHRHRASGRRAFRERLALGNAGQTVLI
jgi:hypothetical protein